MLIESTVDLILSSSATATDRKQAAAAIRPLLATLRRAMETMQFKTAARITTYSPPAVIANESRAFTAERFTHRINDLHCAKSFGTPEDVRAVIDQTVKEVRDAALGRHSA